MAIFLRFTDIAAPRRDDLLRRYADRLVITADRTFCSKQSCTTAQGHDRRFLDVSTCGFGNGSVDHFFSFRADSSKKLVQ